MKYLFTTIDGVLNPIDNSKDYTPNISKECVQNLNNILEKTGAHLILKSAWFDTYSFDSVIKTLKDDYGFVGEVRCEAKDYFKFIEDNDDIEDFMIIDTDESLEEYFEEYLILTDEKEGLTKQIADIAIRGLGEAKNG